MMLLTDAIKIWLSVINNAIYYLIIVLSTSSLLFSLYLIFQINYCLSDYPFQNKDRFSHKDDALQWAACVSLSVHETGRLQDASVHKIVAQSVKRQVVSTLTNFTDIGMNCHILCQFSILCVFYLFVYSYSQSIQSCLETSKSSLFLTMVVALTLAFSVVLLPLMWTR